MTTISLTYNEKNKLETPMNWLGYRNEKKQPSKIRLPRQWREARDNCSTSPHNVLLLLSLLPFLKRGKGKQFIWTLQYAIVEILTWFCNSPISCKLNRAISCKLNRAISWELNRAISWELNRAISWELNRAIRCELCRVNVELKGTLHSPTTWLTMCYNEIM